MRAAAIPLSAWPVPPLGVLFPLELLALWSVSARFGWLPPQILPAPLPSALPSIATGVHLALIYAWVASIGSEYFMTVGPGIGGLIIAGRERFQMDLVMLGILILGLVGFLVNRGASAIEARLLRWRTT